ncbi:MAG: trypsin-like serine protease [Proteobacteria bacterium]|nr:trypsin-like serine protease [Pseudomonadota bacterium]
MNILRIINSFFTFLSLIILYHGVTGCKVFTATRNTDSHLKTDHGKYYPKITDLPGYFAWFRADRSLCSATYIGYGFFITAAHCFIGNSNNQLKFAYIEYIAQSLRGQKIRNTLGAKDFIGVAIHNQFKRIQKENFFDPSNDIAIFKLRIPDNLPVYAKAELPLSNEFSSDRLKGKIWIYGTGINRNVYGSREGFFGGYTHVQKGTTILMNTIHKMTFNFSRLFNQEKRDSFDDSVFYGTNNKDNLSPEAILGVCSGDSGGPVIKKVAQHNVLVGVVSGGVPALIEKPKILAEGNTRSCDSVAIMLNLHSHIGFIDTHMQALNLKDQRQPSDGHQPRARPTESHQKKQTLPDNPPTNSDELFSEDEAFF